MKFKINSHKEMSRYQIKRWDVVLFKNSITKVPVIYIEPDETFKEFAKKNSNIVLCEISNTSTIYDDKKIPGIVNTSENIPGYRPNYYEKNGYYVIILWSNWYGYPNPLTMGEVLFKGLVPSEPIQEDNTSLEQLNVDKKRETYKYSIITFVFIFLLLLLTIFIKK